jgi:4-hydroxybenzoate polyprenyltransferase
LGGIARQNVNVAKYGLLATPSQPNLGQKPRDGWVSSIVPESGKPTSASHGAGLSSDSVEISMSQAVFTALRPHHWVKNLLIFIPLVAAHQQADRQSLFSALLAFLAFCLVASAGYLLNDLFDVHHDRNHPRKRKRPFAARHLSPLVGWLLVLGLILAGFGIARLALPDSFLIILAGYLALSLAYSIWLKRIVLVDVFTLAVLYELRIFAGAAAVGVTVSSWLLTFSMFLLISVAFIKRFNELKLAGRTSKDGKLAGRGYIVQDLDIVTILGCISGCLALVILAFYVESARARELYRAPQLIWFADLLLFYWIARVWLIAHRGEMHDDPIVFALKDKTSWAVALSLAAIYVGATMFQ